jgi:hypothetical protein
MLEQSFETSATPHVTVDECLGDLVVRGSAERHITIQLRNGAGDVGVQREGETFTVTARADCRISCPARTTLTVRTVRGDLTVKGVQGPLAIAAVYGDAALRRVGPTALEQVHGDLSAGGVAGDLQAEAVQGSARVRHVDGLFAVDRVGSDLTADGLHGGLAAGQVGADVLLGPPFSPGVTYRLAAGSDLTVGVPADASLRLAVRAGGGVRSRLPDLDLEESGGETRGVLGGGDASLEAQVGGHATLHPWEPGEGESFALEFAVGLEELGATVEARVAEAVAELEARLDESLGRIDGETVRRRVERVSDRARHEAERGAAERVRRSAEREAERARLRAERAERRWARASGRRSRPRRGGLSDEERLRVLHLVEEGKITPEEAADLLAALEGR